jgi:AraC-like DNA-binding protein
MIFFIPICSWTLLPIAYQEYVNMTQSNILSKTFNFSNQVNQSFEYTSLDSGILVLLQDTNDIKKLMRRTCEDIIRIGQKLIEVEEFLGHGKFISWLKSELDWSVSIATKYMQVGKQFKAVNFTNLNITASALSLIDAPSTPYEARIQVLRRADLRESISYNEMKKIIHQYKKKIHYKFQESTIFNTPTEKSELNYCIVPTKKEDKKHESQILNSVPKINNLIEEDSTEAFPTDVNCKQKETCANISDLSQLIQQLRSNVNAVIESADLLKTHGIDWNNDKKQECLQNLQSAVEQINGLINTIDQPSEPSTSKINEIEYFRMSHPYPQVNQVFEFIESHYQQNIKLDDVAKAVGYSPTYLTDLIRRQTGKSLHRWIIHRRMIAACKLLLETDLSIEQIAETIGYRHVGCFFRQFRLSFDVTPQVWRQENRL